MLTVPKATAQARRHVDKLMPGVLATVDSKLSHDLKTDTPLVITTITFPQWHDQMVPLRAALRTLADVRTVTPGSASYVVVRSR
jgi:hypothetical protein